MPKDVKTAVREVRDNREKTIKLNLSIPQGNWERLVAMRKSKGQQYEQELIRVFISEGLERAGF
jgi:hypothetical protein